MKQRIIVNAIMGGSGDDLKIVSVNETQDKLIVIANFIESKSLLSPATITEIKDEVIVNTSSKTHLPVTYFLTGLSKENFNDILKDGPYRSPKKYLSHFNTPTEFVYLASKDKINDLLSESKCLYPFRSFEKVASTHLSLFTNNRVDNTSDTNQICQLTNFKNTCSLS